MRELGTICDQIIMAHSLESSEDENVRVRVDAVLGHDATIALLVDEFERRRSLLPPSDSRTGRHFGNRSVPQLSIGIGSGRPRT